MFFTSTHSRAFWYSEHPRVFCSQPSPWPSTSIRDQEAEQPAAAVAAFEGWKALPFPSLSTSPFPTGVLMA